jgi:hypothetical protein
MRAVTSDRAVLVARLRLAIALRHPQVARWPTLTRNGRRRMAPPPGGLMPEKSQR